jgi:hypothetical protein
VEVIDSDTNLAYYNTESIVTVNKFEIQAPLVNVNFFCPNWLDYLQHTSIVVLSLIEQST